jgi:H+-translocating NAD(P) transhydrogenase subunit alpha
MYAKNVANFIGLLVRDGSLVVDSTDDLVAGCTVCRGGEITDARVRAALEAEQGVGA